MCETDLDKALESLFPGQGKAKQTGHCVFCRKAIDGRSDFTDGISWREYQVTGSCQTCQDELNPEPPDDGERETLDNLGLDEFY